MRCIMAGSGMHAKPTNAGIATTCRIDQEARTVYENLTPRRNDVGRGSRGKSRGRRRSSFCRVEHSHYSIEQPPPPIAAIRLSLHRRATKRGGIVIGGRSRFDASTLDWLCVGFSLNKA